MVKDVIVNLGVAKNGSVVGNYAASVAAALQAHLTGVAFIYDPIVPISDGGYIPADVVETQRADNEAAAESAVKSFTAATDRVGISAEPLTLAQVSRAPPTGLLAWRDASISPSSVRANRK